MREFNKNYPRIQHGHRVHYSDVTGRKYEDWNDTVAQFELERDGSLFSLNFNREDGNFDNEYTRLILVRCSPSYTNAYEQTRNMR